MLIFFGTRSTKIQSQKVNGHTECPHCNTQNSFIATTFGTYFHVFWVPIITLGRRTVVECSHCKKTYDENDLPESTKNALDRSLQEHPPKKALWHCLGCFIILGAIALFVLLLIYAIIFKTVKEDEFEAYEDDYNYEKPTEENVPNYQESDASAWEYQLKRDLLNTDYNPNIEDDKYSYALKLCLDEPSLGLEEATTSYFSKISDNKILLLIEIENFDGLSEKQKDNVHKSISNCLDDILNETNFEPYCGIFSNKTFQMITTPDGVFKDKDADNEKLMPFYTDDDE